MVCHQVRGVGGQVAPPLDLLRGEQAPSPAEFMATMLRGAPIMVELQRLEIGYQIDLSADDLLHLAAFAADPSEQEKFSVDDVPDAIQARFIDDMYILEDGLPGPRPDGGGDPR